jgi:hypothetical protein
MILVCLSVLQMEIASRSAMRTAQFYRLVSIVAPPVLAGVYTLFVLLMSWILPLFPAEPKLGPVYHHTTRFTPPEFPLLFLIPAFALDLLWQRIGGWGIRRQG